MSDISRRDFLKLARDGFLALSGALIVGGLLRFLDFDPNPAPRTEFELGSADNYPLDSRTVLPEIPAILIHTEQGFFARSLVCAHLGCTLENNPDWLCLSMSRFALRCGRERDTWSSHETFGILAYRNDGR